MKRQSAAENPERVKQQQSGGKDLCVVVHRLGGPALPPIVIPHDSLLTVGDVLVRVTSSSPSALFAEDASIRSLRDPEMKWPGIDRPATALMRDIYHDGGDVAWHWSCSLSRTPGYMRVDKIIAMFQAKLQWPLWKAELSLHDEMATAGDVDPFNLQRLGSHDALAYFTPGLTLSVDNSLDNLLIVAVKRNTRLVRKCVNATQYLHAVCASKIEPVFHLAPFPRSAILGALKQLSLPLGKMHELVFDTDTGLTQPTTRFFIRRSPHKPCCFCLNFLGQHLGASPHSVPSRAASNPHALVLPSHGNMHVYSLVGSFVLGLSLSNLEKK